MGRKCLLSIGIFALFLISPPALAAGSAHSGGAAAVRAPGPLAIPNTISETCGNPKSYPAFGKVCVQGKDWAPPALVAADTHDPAPGDHLNVVSNGHTTNVVSGKNFYGLKWQCTEFAVRWAGVAWGEGGDATWTKAGWVSGAAKDMARAAAKLPHPLQVVPNGSKQAPQKGDLLIFGEASGPGHVGVVIGLDRKAGTLTFIGENQWRAPAVVHVPISAKNVVSAAGFASSLFVKSWLHKPNWTWPGSPTTTVSATTGHPADPVCTTHNVSQGTTSLTVKGSAYKAGEALTIHSVHYFLGSVTVPSTGAWSFTFAIPSRPYGNYAITVDDASGTKVIAALKFLSGSYACFHFNNENWNWDAVGWDAASPMAFSIDGVELDHWTASANGAMPKRSFTYSCPTGDHTWTVTGTLLGGPGYASGSVTCS